MNTQAGLIIDTLGGRDIFPRVFTASMWDSRAGQLTLRINPKRRARHGITHVRVTQTFHTWQVAGYNKEGRLIASMHIQPSMLRWSVQQLTGLALEVSACNLNIN